jgi:hypothetical protein
MMMAHLVGQMFIVGPENLKTTVEQANSEY